jgi:hypothetical protein
VIALFEGIAEVAKRDFIKYHIVEALCGAVAEAEGNEDIAKRLRAMTKLRLINMSEDELWELAKLVSCPPERPVELVYKGIKKDIEEHRATIDEWINDLGKRTEQGGKG